MNQLAERTERLPMDSVGMSTGSTGAKIAPQNLAEVVKFAEVMCRADIALPKHLRGNAGACMAVSLQALDWQMNPFAVASKSYQVNGMIAYEAQLIIAVINTRSGIEGRLEYRFEGEGADKVCIASGKLDGKVLEVRSPKFKDITPKNSPLWKSDPDQQHCYYTGRAWGRRHTPEVILGVYDRDEAEQFQGPDNARDITPQPTVMQRLRQNATQQPTGDREGFDSSFVHSETEQTLTGLDGEILNDETESDAPPPPSDTSDEPPPPSDEETGPAPVSSTSSDTSAAAGVSDSAGDPNPPSESPAPETENGLLIQFARDVLPMAADTETSGAALKAIENEWAPRIKAMSPEGQAKANSISKSMRAIFNGNTSLDSALDYYAEALGCSIYDLGADANG